MSGQRLAVSGQTVVISRKVGNLSNTEKRSRDGRMGRGEDAFTGKITASWKEIERRMDEIQKRNQALGSISVSYPIHARHGWLKATKF